MPLSRSSTSRSKSRSPVPPSSQSPRPFLPPSHYAAAGGFTLPNRNRTNPLDETGPTSQDAYMPVSSKPSSLDFTAAESRPGKSSAENVKYSKKRESQIQNLPLVEAQLLPSLRDTIDRMTRPPSRVSPSTPTLKFSPQQDIEDHGDITRSTYPYSPQPTILSRLKPPAHTPMSHYTSNDRPTSPKQPSTPKVGVLKSALKAPTSKLSLSPAPSAPVSTNPGGGALRSVRSLLRRKSSASTVSTTSSISSNQATKENQPSSSFNVLRPSSTRSRSRTDPGSCVPLEDLPNTHGNPPSTSKTQQMTIHTSHIPRFRGGTATSSDARRIHTDRNTDESDFEYRYEMESRDRRRLTVANAEIVVSSSSSESEVDPYAYNPGRDRRVAAQSKAQDRVQEAKIGLGLMFTQESSRYDGHEFVQQEGDYNNFTPSNRLELDDVQVYRPDHDGGGRPYSHLPITSYPSVSSMYTDDEESELELLSDTTRSGDSGPNPSIDFGDLDETHNRRKAALLGLVRDLDDLQSSTDRSGTGADFSGTGTSILSEGESDYCGEKGLAVSGSVDSGSGTRFDGVASRREYAQARGPQRLSQAESGSEYDFEVGDNSAGPAIGARTPTVSSTVSPSLSSTSGVSRRASQYFPKSTTPILYTEDPVNVVESERMLASKSKKYDHLPPSPCLLPSATGEKVKQPGSSDVGRLRSSRLVPSRPSEDKGQKSNSRRKSYTRDMSPASTATISTERSPSSLDVTVSPALTSLSATIQDPSGNRTDLSVERESYNSYESVVIAKRSKEAAARTRQAFGIPTSGSEEIYSPSNLRDYDGQSPLPSSLPPADSMASGVDVAAVEGLSWEHEGDDELSVGAENLFRTLSLGEGSGGSYDGAVVRGRSQGPAFEVRKGQIEQQPTPKEIFSERTAKSKSRERRQSRHRSRTPVARPKSIQKSPETQQENATTTPEASWRSIIGPSAYKSLLEIYGEMEMKRQEVIWELRTAEVAFVERLSSVVNLFILPLRIQASRTWIAGVPLEIAKVLDWLEDIINLHIQIRDALLSFQTLENSFNHIAGTTGGVAQALCTFVSGLEIYQPYLVKLASVLEMLNRLVRDEESDFGEFVRIQENALEDRNSLTNLLSEPLSRLATYPVLFRKLLDVTPKIHEEYLSTVVLVHSTTLVVKTLLAVKAREEEYGFIKSLSERIDGLPSTTNLARRERRLLCHGQLLRMDLRNHLKHTSNQPNRMSRLVEAINEWDIKRSRSDSVKSHNSASTGISFRSVETSSPPPPPQVLVLVFSDLVVLATTRYSLREGSNHAQEAQGSERWTLCEDIGLARVLGVEGGNSDGISNIVEDDGSASITVDLLPIEFDLDQSVSCSGTFIKTVQFKLPASTSSNPSRESWMSAFQRSSQWTLRALSNPSLSRTSGNIEGPNRLLEQDRQRALQSILDAGLPFPKSPSLQLADESISIGSGKMSGSAQMEREERGWWSLQYQQLLRERWYSLVP